MERKVKQNLEGWRQAIVAHYMVKRVSTTAALVCVSYITTGSNVLCNQIWIATLNKESKISLSDNESLASLVKAAGQGELQKVTLKETLDSCIRGTVQIYITIVGKNKESRPIVDAVKSVS